MSSYFTIFLSPVNFSTRAETLLEELTRIYRNDSSLFSNDLTGMGVRGRDTESATRINVNPVYITEQQTRSLLKDALIYRYITALSSSAIQEGWKLTFGSESTSNDPELGEKVEKYIRQLATASGEKDELGAGISVSSYFYKAQIEACVGDGYKGGSVLLLNIDDGRKPDEPVNIKNIKSLRSVYTLGTREIEPDLIANSRYVSSVEKITHYRLIVPDRLSRELEKLGYLRIHKSRIIRFDGVKYPDQMALEDYQGWSGSRIPAILEEFQRYKTCLSAITEIVKTSSSLIQKVKNLAEILSAKDTVNGDHSASQVEGLREYFRLLRLLQSAWGGIVVDADESQLDYLNRPFNGLDRILDTIRDSFIGTSGIPHDKLFGESPSGLGATGESEEKNWAKDVKSFQKLEWYDGLYKLYKVVFLAKDGPTKGKEPKSWDIDFNSIIAENPQDQVSMRSSQANTDSIYVNLGVLAAGEVRQSRFGGNKYNIETTLNQELFDQEQSEGEEVSAPAGGEGEEFGEELKEELPPEEEVVPQQEELEEFDINAFLREDSGSTWSAIDTYLKNQPNKKSLDVKPSRRIWIETTSTQKGHWS